MAIDPWLDKLIVSRKKSIDSLEADIRSGEVSAGTTTSPSVRRVIEKALNVKRARLTLLQEELRELLAAQPSLPGTEPAAPAKSRPGGR